MDDVKDVESNVGKLTTIVAYYIRYKSIGKLSLLLSFGLGNEVAVNAIIGKPTLKELKDCVDFVKDICTSEELMLQFDMKYKVVIRWSAKIIVRPHTTYSAGLHIVSIDKWNNSATMHTESNDKAETISGTYMDGCFTRSVTTPKYL